MGQASAPTLVLVVDDDRPTREIYSAYLLECGYGVVQAVDGEDALRLAFEVGPDVVVTDLQMPRMDGLELARQLRASPATESTPLVCVTGGGPVPNGPDPSVTGFDIVVPKPVLMELLVRAIEAVLDARQTCVRSQRLRRQAREVRTRKGGH